MLKKIIRILLLIFFLLPVNSNSQPQISWVKRFGLSDWDIAIKVNPDNIGNSYVTGTIGFTTNNAKPGLIKYNLSGDSVWSRIFDPPDSLSSGASTLLMDDSLNIYVSGRYILKYNPSGVLLYSRKYNCSTVKAIFDNNKDLIYTGRNASGQSLLGLILLKCNRNGDSIWKKVYPQFNVYSVTGIEADKNNNIIIASSIYNGSNDIDFLTIKFSPNGNLIWSKTYHGGDPTNGYDEPCGVLLDSLDNIIVSGRSNGPLGGSNYYTVKYDPNGNVLWESRINDGGGSGSWEMIKDKYDNIYISGQTNGNKYSAMKYSSNGQLLWFRTVNGTGGSSVATIALDTARNVYMACNALNSQNVSQYQVVKYNNNGDLIWNVVYSGNPIYYYYSFDIAVDNSGNVFVTGEAGFAGSSYDFTTIKIDQTTGIIQNLSEIPKSYSLSQNYPNPFNPTTNINYEIPNSNFVTLKVYDINGKEIETLVNQKQNAGGYSVTFNAGNYPSGVYFYKLETNNFSETKKMILLK